MKGRFAVSEHKAPQQQQQQDQQELRGGLGLSFSGGGFRATAFSLGTLTLLQDLGLLAQAKVMSSVSGGSLALGTYLCAKAGSGAQKEADFDFDGLFYEPLMRFLEEERLAVAFVNAKELVGGGKLILKAAQATQVFFNERLEAGGTSIEKEAVFGNPKITAMLANDKLSPDYIFFNATNITSLDLFRFGIQRGSRQGESKEEKEPVFVLNRYFLKHNRESAEGKALYQFAQDLRIADCVAASFGFPAGFEPLLFPDDFIEKEEVRQHFRGDLICDHKPYLAFLDGGLYDNLGLASIEDIRRFLDQPNEKQPGQQQSIHYVIATDVDQIPTQYSAYTDPETDRYLQQTTTRPKRKQTNSEPSLWLIRGLIVGVIVLLALDILSLGFLLKPLGSMHWIPTVRSWVLLGIVSLVAVMLAKSREGPSTAPKEQLGLSSEFPKEASLDSWTDLILLLLKQLFVNPTLVWRAISSRRIGQSSYSWIPLICEMATNVPTTLWLNGAHWYTPNLYDSHQRIRSNGKWSVDMPKEEDLPDPGIKPINLSTLGKAPAAAVCTVAGYVSTCFNLLEFFYTWLGNCSHAQEGLLQLLKQEPFHFQSSEQLKEMEELPYTLRTAVWKQLKAEGGHLPKQTLDALPLLEYPLNRRNGLPESYWAGKLEE